MITLRQSLEVSVYYLPQIAQIHTDKFVIICEICGKELTTMIKNKITLINSLLLLMDSKSLLFHPVQLP